MPQPNNFRHQAYSADLPTAKFHFVEPEIILPGSNEFQERLANVGEQLERASVKRIYLVHGSFTGTDGLGLIREIAGFAPGMAKTLSIRRKQIADSIVGDNGNFTNAYQSLLNTGVNAVAEKRIQVVSFDWSSENNHLGRAEAAVRLIAEVGANPEGRSLLVGHSHAGNVFALVSNLFTANDEVRESFFDATADFYSQKDSKAERWPTIDSVLRDSALASTLDFVTLGTPIRYGWDTSGYGNLLHFVNHRRCENLPDYLTPFPNSIEDVLHAKHGDYVQQFGIVGTNFLPYLLRTRNVRVERKLSRLLQPSLRKRDTWDRLQIGMRVHQNGTTLLADYPDDPGKLRELSFGHGVYTRSEYMLFHFEEIVRRFYHLE